MGIPTSDGCLDEESLVRLAAHRMPPADVENARDHLDSCEPCSAALLVLVRGTWPSADGPSDGKGPHGALPAGTRLGRFTLERVLGSGNMGTVFTARDPQLGRTVAIKLLRAGRTDERNAARLLREAKAMAQIRHPNVVTVYEVGQDDDVVFVAMEQIRGPTLRSALAAERPSIAVMRDWLAQIGCGLSAVHAAGMVHRDLKPDNIFIEGLTSTTNTVSPKACRVVVGDLGLAVASEHEYDGDAEIGPSQTATRGAGTPAYMAPEQLRRELLDHRADVFAYGVTAWEMLTGRRPFDGDTVETLVEAIRQGPSREALRSLPAPLASVLESCVQYRREDRPASIDEVVALVTATRPPRRSRTLLAMGLVAAVAFGGMAVISASRGSSAAVACDPAAPARWSGERITWPIVARSMSPFVRESITTMMDRRAEAWQRAAVSACHRDAIAQQAWRTCRRRLEAMEARLLDLAVERRWVDDRQLITGFERLEPPVYCSSTEAAEDAVAMSVLPSDVARAAVDDGLGWIVRAHALADLEAAQQVTPALAAADHIAITVRPSQLDGELALAHAMLQPKPVPADQMMALKEAAAAAERSGRSSLVARAWLNLAEQSTAFSLDATTVDQALAQADWAITRLGDPPRLRASWLTQAGVTAWSRGDHAGAKRRFAASAAIAGDDPALAVEQRATLAKLATLGGDDRQAAAIYGELLADPDFVRHITANDRMDLYGLRAECLYRLGDLAEAREEIERARELARANLRPYDPNRIGNDLILSSILVDLGELRGALDLLEGATPLLVQALGADHPLVADARGRMAQVLVHMDRPDDAAREATAAIQIFDARYGRRNEGSIAARINLADTFRGDDRWKRRAVVFAEALADADAVYGPEHLMSAQIAATDAYALIALHRAQEARQLLERAVRVLVSAGVGSSVTGRAEYELALLVESSDHARAITLATAAEVALAGDNAMSAGRAEVKRWLRAHRR